MKRLSIFLKTTIVGGLCVLLPLSLFYLLLAEILGLVVAIATPIADLFPKETFGEIKLPVILALILILLVSFLFGLAIRSSLLRRFGLWIERTLLGPLPLYSAIKRLSLGLLGAGDASAFRPAVLHSSDDEREIIYVIEEHSDGCLTILVPWAPTSFAGSVKIVSRDRVEMLDRNLGDTSMVLSHWGVGVRDLLKKPDNR